MIKIVKAQERHPVDTKHQHGYWLFSYEDYMDMQNLNLGDMRVFNDIILKPGKALKLESASDKEIITIVLEGELNHQDSTGASENLGRGDIYVMSCGQGISFSGMNTSQSNTHFCSIWIQSLRQGMEALCRRNFFDTDRSNELLPVVSGQGFKEALKMRSNATVYLSRLGEGKTVDMLTDISRYVLIYVLEGKVNVCGESLDQYDQARINQNENIVIKADRDAFFVLVDVAGMS